MKPHYLLGTFGERLRWVRQKYGLSLEDFASKFNAGRSYLSKLERGHAVNPSPQLLDVLCQTYSVRKSYLLEGHGDPFTSEDLNEKAREGMLFPPMAPATKPGTSVNSEQGPLAVFLGGAEASPTIEEMLERLHRMLAENWFGDALTLRIGAAVAEHLRARLVAERKHAVRSKPRGPKIGSQETS